MTSKEQPVTEKNETGRPVKRHASGGDSWGDVRGWPVTEKNDVLTDAQIKHMTQRFLGWKLPENFNPDAGISFEPEFNVEWNAKQGRPPQRHEPSGTNLFNADEAEAMVRYMIEGLPRPTASADVVERVANELRQYRHSMSSATLAEHILAIPRIHNALSASPVQELVEALERLVIAVDFEVPPILDGIDVERRLRILLECAAEARATLAKVRDQSGASEAE